MTATIDWLLEQDNPSVRYFTLRHLLHRLEKKPLSQEVKMRQTNKQIGKGSAKPVKRAEEEYQTIISTALDGFWITDTQGHFLDVNDAYCHLIGYSREELLKMGVQNVEAAEKSEETAQHIQKLLEIGYDRFETQHRCKDGRVVDIEVSANFTPRQDGRFYVFLRDITARKRAEDEIRNLNAGLEQRVVERTAQLSESEEHFRALLENNWDLIGVVDQGGLIRYITPSVERLLGYRLEEVLGQPMLDFIHPDDMGRAAEALAQRVQQPGVADAYIEVRLRHKDGSWRVLEGIGMNLLDNPAVGGIVINARDITERKRAEERDHSRNHILTSITAGEPLAAILELIARSVEAEEPEAICSILLLDNEGQHLLIGAAPNLPDFYNQAIHGLKIGNGVGSCGTAAYTKQRVVVEDILTHPYWADFRELAQKANLRSCWSEPILSTTSKVLGAFAIYHREPRSPSSEDIERIKSAADFASLAIERKQAEEEIQRENDTRTVLNTLLRLSLEDVPLDELLAQALDLTLSIPWLAFESSGAILLAEDDQVLVLKNQRGLAEPIQRSCARVPFGKCLCGRAAAEQKIMFADCLDVRHETTYEGIRPHGHYCVPILSAGKTLGAINVYLREGHHRDIQEEKFLLAIADTLAGSIEHKRAEEKIEQQLARLNSLNTIDTAILSTTDLRLALKAILEEAKSQLRADIAAIMLLDPHTLMLEFAANIGYRIPATARFRVRMGEGIAGKAALERRTIVVPDLAEAELSAPAKEMAAAEGTRSIYATPLIVKGQVVGVMTILFRTPFHADQDWLDFFETLARQIAIAIDSIRSFESLQRGNIDLMLAYDATIEGWSHAMDLRDKETEGHTLRVTELTERLARTMGMSEAEIIHVRRGALLHDMGKMGIPDAILLKPDKLTDEEWVIMRRHPQFAYDMLSPITYLRPALDIPYCHHEKWDGTGYPRGLKGEQIPLAARIFAVIDVYDALTSDRPYRKAWPREKVIEHIKAGAGSHFDPKVVEAFINLQHGLKTSN